MCIFYSDRNMYEFYYISRMVWMPVQSCNITWQFILAHIWNISFIAINKSQKGLIEVRPIKIAPPPPLNDINGILELEGEGGVDWGVDFYFLTPIVVFWHSVALITFGQTFENWNSDFSWSKIFLLLAKCFCFSGEAPPWRDVTPPPPHIRSAHHCGSNLD